MAVRALFYELPLLVLPMHPTPDQAIVGRAIADFGPDQSCLERRAADIAAAITELAGSGPHRMAAARLGAAIREHDSAVAGADQIIAMAQPR